MSKLSDAQPLLSTVLLTVICSSECLKELASDRHCAMCNVQVDNTNNLAGKGRGKHKPPKKKGFCSCFG